MIFKMRKNEVKQVEQVSEPKILEITLKPEEKAQIEAFYYKKIYYLKLVEEIDKQVEQYLLTLGKKYGGTITEIINLDAGICKLIRE